MSDEAAGVRGSTQTTEPTLAQAQLARRVAETRATVPDLTLRVLVDVDDALATGAELLDLAIRGAARALRDHPRVNGAYRDGRFETYERVNVGVVLDAGDGLTVPTIFDADALGVEEIAARRAELTRRALTGELTAPERRGQTFTVQALDVDAFTPLVGPGHAAALGVGAPRPTALAGADGRVVVRRAAQLTLACDHRIVFGDAAASFLSAVAAATASA